MNALSRLLLYVTPILYLSASICYFKGSRNKRIVQTAFALSVIAFVFNLSVLVIRAIEAGRLPLANGSEFLLGFVCTTVLMYLIYQMKTKTGNVGGMVTLMASLLLLSVAILTPDQLEYVSPLLPALKSPWLAIHVLSAVTAYSGFTLAAGLALFQLTRTNSFGEEDNVYKVVATAFALLSLSIVSGAVWAEQVWGNYWSWDPKETWSLATWIVYALYLHLRWRRGWKGKNANILVVVGFVLILFTFFGVNYLLPGLHSYALKSAVQIWIA
ncbi:cytochrome c biogenesis protein CcsA [Syntrophothermus lipocalidus]|uniref:Cytochrome c-type biogenesis protein CcsB n=1 Tax=Syntrophothermus lipocalidus (strain DSM 12680 / TGB-C1) TaxID=643648 RepID=D7CP00_SYNLT|nr:cytochrome c biogenesis protein CcsA [Syntrophothermus lipocalidus]ADI02435.1 cytochrome c-type biogenesis protein CcsB [Syntrophothermus lipocalidus DSM 12680]